MKFPESHLDLLQDETKAFAFLATLMADGSPQVTPLWFDIDGDMILINSAKGRAKDRNMRKNGHVAVAIPDPKNPYRYLQVRGVVIEITEEGAREHINRLSYKYTGSTTYRGSADETRVTYRIRPVSFSAMG